MKQLQAKFMYTVTLCLAFTSFIHAKLTTLRHFDPRHENLATVELQLFRQSFWLNFLTP